MTAVTAEERVAPLRALVDDISGRFPELGYLGPGGVLRVPVDVGGVTRVRIELPKQFLHLQSRISGLENAIADRREFYNESVNINNVAIEQFPGVLLARWFSFKAFELLKFAAEELQDVDIGQRFKG